MAKKITLSEEEQKLYNELKKLAKQSNQRILRLEREYGTNTWATKKLRDKLDTIKLNAWTEGNRVRVSKKFSKIQMKGIIHLLENFIHDKTSRVARSKRSKRRADTKYL